MKTYCISLLRSTARREAAVKMLERLGYAYEIVEAADGLARTAPGRIVRQRPQSLRPLLDAEIGCYQSHLDVWARVAASGAPWAMVIEDDVRLRYSARQVLRSLQRFPRDFDFLHGDPNNRGRVAQRTRHWIRYNCVALGTYCYVISARLAAHLCAHGQIIQEPVDNMLQRCSLAGEYAFYGSTRPLARHDDDALSSIWFNQAAPVRVLVLASDRRKTLAQKCAALWSPFVKQVDVIENSVDAMLRGLVPRTAETDFTIFLNFGGRLAGPRAFLKRLISAVANGPVGILAPGTEPTRESPSDVPHFAPASTCPECDCWAVSNSLGEQIAQIPPERLLDWRAVQEAASELCLERGWPILRDPVLARRDILKHSGRWAHWRNFGAAAAAYWHRWRATSPAPPAGPNSYLPFWRPELAPVWGGGSAAAQPEEPAAE